MQNGLEAQVERVFNGPMKTGMKITQALLAEHVVFHNLFDHLEQTAPKLKTLAEVRTLSSLLAAMLDAHSKIEDRLLIDPLEPSLHQLGQDKSFHDEHDEIDRTLAQVHSTRRPSEARGLLLKAVLLCRKHFDKEERIMFPLAERQLSAKSLLLLGNDWMEQRAALAVGD